jgi:hypothetical protein
LTSEEAGQVLNKGGGAVHEMQSAALRLVPASDRTGTSRTIPIPITIKPKPAPVPLHSY